MEQPFRVNKIALRPEMDWKQAVYAFQRNGKLKSIHHQLIANWLKGGDLRLANPDIPEEKRLIDFVIEGCSEKNIRDIPPVCIGHTNIINAASAGGQLIVFTTEIMKRMPKEQLRAVVGHELSHHRHVGRDLSLQLGFVVALHTVMESAHLYPSQWARNLWDYAKPSLPRSNAARTVAGWALGAAAVVGNFWLVTLPANIHRHFMEREADREGADYAGARAMGDALETLKREAPKVKRPEPQGMSGYAKQGLQWIARFLLMPLGSHPSTESRIAAMRQREAIEGPGAHETASDIYKEAVQRTAPGTYINAHRAEHGVLHEAALEKAVMH